MGKTQVLFLRQLNLPHCHPQCTLFQYLYTFSRHSSSLLPHILHLYKIYDISKSIILSQYTQRSHTINVTIQNFKN